MKRIMAILLTLCIFLPGCTSPSAEIDEFYGDDLPGDDPEYDVKEFSLVGPDGNYTN